MNPKKRQQLGQALSQLSKAAEQATGINESLRAIPEALKGIRESKEILDRLSRDYQTLSAELKFLRFLVQRTSNLTPEAEAEYRREFEAAEIRDSG